MKKNPGLIVLAFSLALVIAPLASAAPQSVPPPPPAAAMAAPPPVPPAPPAPASVAVTAPLPPAPAPAPAAVPAPPAPTFAVAPQEAPKAPRPARAPDAPKAARPPEAPQAPEPPPPPGRERAEPDQVNVRFEVTIAAQTATGSPIKRTAVLTVANNTGLVTPSGSLRSGNNVPVPTTTFTPLVPPARAPDAKPEDGKEPPLPRSTTSYNYRSVGINVDVQQAVVLPSNRVRATLSIEFSGVDERASASTGAPAFPTFSQRVALYLESGKPVVVAQSNDFVDNVERKQTVEVKATILR